VKFFTLTHSSTDPGVPNFLSRQTERQRSQAFQAASKQTESLFKGLKNALTYGIIIIVGKGINLRQADGRSKIMKHTIYLARTRQVAFEGSAYECWKWLTSQLADGCFYKTWEADGERYCDVGSVYIIR
jgi:hypothetical protein